MTVADLLRVLRGRGIQRVPDDRGRQPEVLFAFLDRDDGARIRHTQLDARIRQHLLRCFPWPANHITSCQSHAAMSQPTAVSSLGFMGTRPTAGTETVGFSDGALL